MQNLTMQGLPHAGPALVGIMLTVVQGRHDNKSHRLEPPTAAMDTVDTKEQGSKDSKMI